MTCRNLFGFLIVDGLYDDYACAGRIPPSEAPPEQWPREHFVFDRRTREKKVKATYYDERTAQRHARKANKTAYLCTFCQLFHIGTLYKSSTNERGE